MKIPGSGQAPQEGQSPYDFLLAQGYEPKGDIPLDGKLRRFRHNCGAGDAAWAVFHALPFPRGKYGCHRCGVNEKWNGLGRELTDEEKRQIEKMGKEREAEALDRQESVATYLKDIFLNEAELAQPDHPVLVAKGIKPHGVFHKVAKSTGDDVLLVPLSDINGKLWSLQGIAPKPIKAFGDKSKSFERGGRISGCFFPIGLTKAPPERLLICEGYATGASIAEATELPVLCAMSANNLINVAKACRSKWPQAAITICADNDRHTQGNPGLDHAESAALATNSAMAVPDFTGFPDDRDHTDFNDLARVKGIEAVRDTILATVPPERPSCYYDTSCCGWWTKAEGNFYIPTNEGAVKRILHISGLARYAKGDNPTAIDLEVNRIMMKESVIYAGPVAGWPVGIHTMSGRRVLVTDSAKIMQAGGGSYQRLLDILLSAFGDEQTVRFLLWIRVARDRIRFLRWHPMPALVMVGPKDCGKSFAQEIITRALGGRVGKPTMYLQGDTTFNADLFGAEHLMIEDETAKTDALSRRHMGEKIKTLLFCKNVQCHGKRQKGIPLEPFWALSITLNDEPEHMMVIPTIDASLSDKIIILRAQNNQRPVPEGKTEAEWLLEVLAEEMPALMASIDSIQINELDPALTHHRTIIRAWQHPEVLAQISELSTEMHFWALVEDVLFGADTGSINTWKGTAEELSRRLRDSRYSREVERLLSWPTACGVFMGRCMAKKPDRIRRTRDRGDHPRAWVISPPGFDVNVC